MLVKLVLKENGSVCRADNGNKIGTRSDYITYNFFTTDGKFTQIRYGFFSEDGNFNELCQETSCSHACLLKRKPECRYSPKGNDTEAFYFETDN